MLALWTNELSLGFVLVCSLWSVHSRVFCFTDWRACWRGRPWPQAPWQCSPGSCRSL